MSLVNGINDPKCWVSLRTRLYFKDRIEIAYPRSKIFLGGHGLLSKYNQESCRETLVYFIRDELLYVNRKYWPKNNDNKGVLAWPDWTRWYSYMFFIGCGVKEPLEELRFISKELVCHLMAQLFGEVAYNLKIWVGKARTKSKTYGTPFEIQKVLIIKFPNCFLSSPAAFSIFVSHLRKSVYLASKSEIEGGYFDRCFKEVQDQSGSYKKMRNIIKGVNANIRDPFYSDSAIGGHLSPYPKLLIHKFPLEFFDFLVENNLAKESVFSQDGYCRNNTSLTYDSGYRQAIYRSGKERIDKFVEYLKLKGEEV